MRNAVLLLCAIVLVAGTSGCCLLSGKVSGTCGCGGLGLGKGVLVKSKGAVNPVPAASGPVTADGGLDEPAWKKAVAMTDFVAGPDRPAVKTCVLVTYDKANLYVAVVCEEPGTGNLVATTTKRDGSVWNDDSLEIYVDPTNAKDGEYFGFFVNCKNVVYDRTRDSSWSSTAWKSGTKIIDGKGWVAEIVVPWKILGVQPKVGHKFGLMVARNRKVGGNQYLTLVPCNGEPKDTTKYPVLELK